MNLQLIPIYRTLEENQELKAYPECMEVLAPSIEFYKKIGFQIPWIGYFVRNDDNEWVGSCGYKGQPQNHIVEIAYGTTEKFRNIGIGTGICKILVDRALSADATVKIRARTFEPTNYSSRILLKNGFVILGTVDDLDDGKVWEWEYFPK